MARDAWKISVAGDKELQAAMRGIERKLGRKVIRASVRDAAKLILREAKARAPILTPREGGNETSQMPRPGTLRKGLRVHVGIPKKYHYRVNVDFKERSKMGIPEKDDKKGKWYAPMAVEVGRSGRAKHGPKEGVHFMIRAYVRKRKLADKTIIGKIRTGLFKIWKSDTRRPR